jgi:DNA-binding CsgD family transcriptional regulator/DNA-binding XRE family transcriptional regulator
MTAPVLVGPSPQGGGPAPSPDWDDLLADIGDRIRAERQARGWSQTELGHRAGLDRGAVRRLEDGNATLRCFIAACTALQVDFVQVLSAEWQVPALKPVLTPAQARVLRAVASAGSAAAAAVRLGIPQSTVRTRLSEISRRLGVVGARRGEERRVAVVRAAVEHGLLPAKFGTS